jgi:hypothetical protein
MRSTGLRSKKAIIRSRGDIESDINYLLLA